MHTLWFILISLMLVAYAILDGFDLGAGAISHFVAKSHDERRLVMRTIGPVWDGNEVWLIATGGAMYFAFPLLYASSFSGFYLPLMMVLWLLMLRGVGIELRSHLENPLWWTACEFIFSASSLLLALFFGVAIANVVRGVPLGADHFFFEPLWTSFLPGTNPGILDWYTVLVGVLSLVALSLHGAHYVAMKTEGAVQHRARKIAMPLGILLFALTIVCLFATLAVRPQTLDSFEFRPWGIAIPVLVFAALIAMPVVRARGRDALAFLASAIYLAAMLGGAAFALYPDLLPATANPAMSLTITNSATGDYALGVGLAWWLVGIVLATAYFVFLYRSFRGKIPIGNQEGY